MENFQCDSCADVSLRIVGYGLGRNGSTMADIEALLVGSGVRGIFWWSSVS
jgi:hypothetical protein